MNKILEATLQVARAIAAETIPGAKVVDKVVTKAVKDKKFDQDDVPELAEATIQLIENFKGADIADEAKFRAAVVGLQANFKLLQESLKHSEVK